MPVLGWWHSFERMDALFRVSRNVAIAALTLGAACWIGGLPLAAVAGAVAGTTAVLIMLFSWFRRDDLARGGGSG
jgi:hypothetical protein